MDTFKELITTLCLAGIGLAIYKMMIPSGTYEKQIRVLVSLVFILGIISPFARGEISFPVSATGELVESVEYARIEEQANSYLKSHFTMNLETSLVKSLEEKGIEVDKILVNVDISKEYSISINEVRVLISNKADTGAVKAAIKKEVGEDTEIQVDILEVESDG
ncbi:MAG: hypothetical protein GX988_00435 [Clostridiales bacterium]|nr:hypothetical protein [Clostridiales bacterium]